MIIMALDHVRDYFHEYASTDYPTNLFTTTPSLFFTRWITHFCAPTFVFLAGISAYLMGQRKTGKELGSFLIKRGCWLVIVELLIVTMGWTFDPLYHVFILQVIWAIGISMIILGLLVRLPSNWILAGGLLIIFFHNMLDYAENDHIGKFNLLWEFAHHGNFARVMLIKPHIALIVYAFLPWTGIMMTGYGMGKLFTAPFNYKRRKILFITGSASVLIFLILRSVNQYGDPMRWHMQRDLTFSRLSFLNVSKYPPSLDYITLTIGVAILALGIMDRISKDSFSFVRVFGRVPFFYYVVHIYLIHTVTVIIFYLQGYTSKDIHAESSPFLFRPDHFGFSLGPVYLLWISMILILYPICSWYDEYKRTHKKWWLSYL